MESNVNENGTARRMTASHGQPLKCSQPLASSGPIVRSMESVSEIFLLFVMMPIGVIATPAILFGTRVFTLAVNSNS